MHLLNCDIMPTYTFKLMHILKSSHPFYYSVIAGLLTMTVFSTIAGPGKTFESIRFALVEQYDDNGDGWLNSAERETMRKDAKQSTRGRGGRGFPAPPGWLEKYDENQDGELDSSERMNAFQTEQAILKKKYDADSNGELGETEKAKLKSDLENGNFQGFERWIARSVGGFERGRRGGFGRGNQPSGRQSDWLMFDLDEDGLANPEELDMIRAFEKKTIPAQ